MSSTIILKKVGSELYRSISKMWELPQITILQTNSKIVGTNSIRANLAAKIITGFSTLVNQLHTENIIRHHHL